MERFVRLVAGDANWNGLDPSLRAWMLSSADTYFDIEIGKFDTDSPDASTLARTTAIQLVVSDGSLPYFAQAATRLAARLGVEVTPTSGTHFAYLDHPEELADSMKPFLRGLSSTNPAAPAQALTDSSALGQHSPQDHGPQLASDVPSGHRPITAGTQPVHALDNTGYASGATPSRASWAVALARRRGAGGPRLLRWRPAAQVAAAGPGDDGPFLVGHATV